MPPANDMNCNIIHSHSFVHLGKVTETHNTIMSLTLHLLKKSKWTFSPSFQVSVKAINQAKSFEITASSLSGGYDYVASVRCNYTEYPAYWSEWSEEVGFHYGNSVRNSSLVKGWYIVLLTLLLSWRRVMDWSSSSFWLSCEYICKGLQRH